MGLSSPNAYLIQLPNDALLSLDRSPDIFEYVHANTSRFRFMNRYTIISHLGAYSPLIMVGYLVSPKLTSYSSSRPIGIDGKGPKGGLGPLFSKNFY